MNIKGITLPLILIGVAAIVAVVFLASRFRGKVSPVEEAVQRTSKIFTGGDFDFDEDTPGYENYQKLIQGCPGGKDCIPSIDNPKFEPAKDADSWLEDADVVFVLEYKDIIFTLYPEDADKLEFENIVRAYPQRILNWHEIVNDDLVGEKVAVTFCPLCGSALAFDRRHINGQTLEFGVSGKLHNNDLVMYDRQTETLWQQITGEAIVGKLFGKRLTQIPLSGMRWSQFKKEFPKAEVLSRDTGFSRNYDLYPYGDYEKEASALFPVEEGVDQTIHPKTVVYGLEVSGKYKAYSEDKIAKAGEIKDKIGDVQVQVLYNKGDILVKRLDTNEEIPATRLFWFAWKAFRPETELY